MCPYAACSALIAARLSARSRRVSPMPTRMPVVKGICSSPASRIIARRSAGSLSGALWCAPPRSRKRDLARLRDVLDGRPVAEHAQRLAVAAEGDLGLVAETHQRFDTALRLGAPA